MAKDYTNEKYTFPSDNIDPEEKKKAPYSLAWAKAAYSLYQNGGIGSGLGSGSSKGAGSGNSLSNGIALLRLYSQGLQPASIYIDKVCAKDKMGKRKSYVDLNFKPISIIPKFKNIIIGKFMQMHHEIEANAVDENSGAERRSMRYSLWAKSQMQSRLKPYQELVESGMNPAEAQQIIPKTIDELDMLESVGSFKLKWESGMEKLLKDSADISDWESIKHKLYEDIFDLGTAATRDYTDLATGKAMTRYVDQAKLVRRFSIDRKFGNIDYAGEVLDLSPNQIRTQAGSDLPDEIIEQIIKDNSDKNSSSFNNIGVGNFYEKYGNNNISVLDLTWVTNDTLKQETVTSDNGDVYVNNVGYNFEKRSDNQEILEGKIQMVYRCKWVVGTDYVYGFGEEEDIIRPTPKTVKLPFNIYRVSYKSILESMIPFEDSINLAWLRYQNTIAKAPPPGMAVDIAVLKNVTDGKNKLTPLDVLEIRRQTGDLLFSSTTQHNQILSPNSSRPVFDLPGGADGFLQSQERTISFNINMIRDVTGVNEIVDATAPAPNTLVGTAEMAQQGTNNTLYPLYLGYKSLYEGTASNLSYRIQNIIRHKDYKPYNNVIGSALLNMFKQGSPIAESSYGIKLSLKPQDQEKQALLAQAGLAFQQGILNFSDIMFLQQEVTHGSIKHARMYIMWKEDKYKEEEQAKVQANTEAQSAAIMEQQENAKSGRMEEAEFNSGLTKGEIAFRAESDAREYGEKNIYKKEEDDNKSKNKVIENLTK